MTANETPQHTTQRSEQEVRALIRELVIELAPNQDAVTAADPHLVDDLGYHSLAVLELAFTLEDEFDLEPIDQEAAQEIQTARAVEDYVVAKLRERAASLATPESGET
jgi:acyl carrier protein